MRVKIFQIYYDTFTKQRIDSELIPVFNPPSDRIKEEILFENAVIEKVYQQNHDADFLGVTSWKMSEVTGMTGRTLIQRVEDNRDMDVILYCPKLSPAYYTGNIIQRYAERKSKQHDLMKVIDQANILPHKLCESQWVFNFRNYWIAKKSVFNDFVEHWTVPLNNFFRNNELHYPVKYKGTNYNAQPFVSEVLVGVYLANNPHIKFIQL